MRGLADPVTGEPPHDSAPPDQEVGIRRPQELEGHSLREGSLPHREGENQRAVPLEKDDDAGPSSASSETFGDTAFPEGVPSDLTPVPGQLPPMAGQGPEPQSVPTQQSPHNKSEAGSPPVPGDPSRENPARAGSQDKSPSVVRPRDFYKALLEARKTAINEPPRAEWLTTLAELSTIVHDSAKIEAELVPPGKKRFPRLQRKEKVTLFQLFEVACVSCDATYAVWTEYATKVTQTLYNTDWTFQPIVQSIIGKV